MAKGKKQKPDFLDAIPAWKKVIIAFILLLIIGIRIEWKVQQNDAPVRSIPSTQVLRPTISVPISGCILPTELGSEFTRNERATWPKVYGWCPLIMKEGLTQGVNPNWIACVMSHESGGNPEAYSVAGAAGLLQVMASNGESARRYPGMFRNRPTVQELFNPEINVRVGVGILRSYLESNATLADALKGYSGSRNYAYSNTIMDMCEKLEAIS